MTDFVEKLAATGQLTPAQLERIGNAVSEFLDELRDDPVLMKEAQEKLSVDWSKKLVDLGNKASGGAAAAAGGLGVLGLYNLAYNKIKGLKDDFNKAKYYKSMVESNPELADEGADSTLIQNHFNTLYRFNPDYAKDPMVAGAYVMQSMDSARPNLMVLNQMVDARKKHVESENYLRETPATKKFINMVSRASTYLTDD